MREFSCETGVKSFKTRLGTKKILKFNGLSWTIRSSCVGKNVLSARAVCFSARVHYGQNFYFCPKIMSHFFILEILLSHSTRVSVQGVKSLGGHFVCLCQGFEFYEVKFFFVIIFQKENGNTFTLLIIFIVKSLQKEQNSTNLLLWPPICQNKPAITPKWFNSLDTNSSTNCSKIVSINKRTFS